MAHIARTQRGLEPVHLGINPNVLLRPNVMITNAPSNQAGVVKVPAATALDNLDLEVIYKRTDWKVPEIQERLKTADKYELLIPNGIDLGDIVHGL